MARRLLATFHSRLIRPTIAKLTEQHLIKKKKRVRNMQEKNRMRGGRTI
jgi:hypothetical protein